MSGTFILRPGQWVKFDRPDGVQMPNVATSADGKKIIGLFLKSRRDAAGNIWPNRVVPVTAVNGENIPDLDTFSQTHISQTLFIPLDKVTGLEPVTDMHEVPAERRKTSHPDWKPKA